jgi:hypothetical protein
MTEKLILEMDLEHGILTLEGIRELLKLKKEGIDIDMIDWRPKVQNYLFIKSQRIEQLTEELERNREQFLEAMEIRRLLEDGRNA